MKNIFYKKWMQVKLKRPTRVGRNVCAELLYTRAQSFTAGKGVSRKTWQLSFLYLPILYN